MLLPENTTHFERDVKKLTKKHRDIEKLKIVIAMIIEEKPLPAKYFNHSLSGNWKGHQECHIEKDWLLIYQVVGNVVVFARTGNHKELFGI